MSIGKFKTIDIFKIENIALCARVVISFLYHNFSIKNKNNTDIPKIIDYFHFLICIVKINSMFRFTLKKYHNFCFVSINS